MLHGKSVIYRSSGNSLKPLVKSNDRTTYDPVRSPEEVMAGDTVFCCVQPGHRFYAHLVKYKQWWESDNCWYFTISNSAGIHRENGWCRIEHIYGKLVECES